MTSESCPGSTTLSTSALASLGSSGISLMTRLATSLTFITSASSSTSVDGRVRQRLHPRRHERVLPAHFQDANPRDPLQDHREVVLGQLDDLEDAGRAADHVEIAGARLLGARVALGDDADDGALLGDRLLDQLHRLLAAHVDGDDRPREQHRVPQGENGDDVGDLDRPFGHRLLGGHVSIVYATRLFRQSSGDAKSESPGLFSGEPWAAAGQGQARGKIGAYLSQEGSLMRLASSLVGLSFSAALCASAHAQMAPPAAPASAYDEQAVGVRSLGGDEARGPSVRRASQLDVRRGKVGRVSRSRPPPDQPGGFLPDRRPRATSSSAIRTGRRSRRP